MLKLHHRLIALCLLVPSITRSTAEPEKKEYFSQPAVFVAMELCWAIWGTIYGTYHLGRLVKETIAFRQTKPLAGYSEEELSCGPLNEFCRQILAEKSTADFHALFRMASPQDLSEAQKSAHRYKILCHFNLYQFPVFRRIIQQWPEYADHLLLTHHALKSSTKLRRCLDGMQGFKKGELRAYLQSELHRLNLDSPDNPLYTLKVDLPRPKTTL